MSVDEMMAKAEQACKSSRLLLDAGDPDGATHRTHYAMFDAASALLLDSGTDPVKTHRGLLTAFSERFVKGGILPKSVGRHLKKVAEAL